MTYKFSNSIHHLLIFCFVLIFGFNAKAQGQISENDLNKDVEMITDYGTIIMRLSDETPLHRDNFIKLVNDKFYDGLSFHRVIENFIVQTGDPESKNSNSKKELGDSDLPYRIPAEFNTNLFHKRGALNAAREGDNSNPEQESSSTQFTIVQGKVYNDSTLDVAQGRINKWLAYNNVIHKPEHAKLFKSLQKLFDNWNDSKKEKYAGIKKQLDSLTEIELSTMDLYQYPKTHREVYKTLGGAAHLDQNYTVFGQVVSGMDIVDKIGAAKTNDMDRPLEDVRIITARLIDRKDYKN